MSRDSFRPLFAASPSGFAAAESGTVTSSWQLSRRTLLQGAGAAIALPWLETMGPVTAWADRCSPGNKGHPNRLAVLYVPNGVNMADWTPASEGTGFELPPILEPLANVRDDFSVLTGLTADKARPHGDGGGDHHVTGAFLTGAQPRKTDGTDIRSGISVDQVAASRRLAISRGCRHSKSVQKGRGWPGIVIPAIAASTPQRCPGDRRHNPCRRK